MPDRLFYPLAAAAAAAMILAALIWPQGASVPPDGAPSVRIEAK